MKIPNMLGVHFVRNIAVIFLFFLLLPASKILSAPKNQSDILEKLYLLEPLPKPHYSWNLECSKLYDEQNDRLLYELARITHALSIAGEWVSPAQVDKCVYTCARINKTKPQIECSIGINFSPWHRRFGKDLPPTDRGATYYAEIDYFADRMKTVSHWIAEANKKYMSDVKIGAILLDSERFYIKPNDKTWNEGVREALDAIHIKTKEIFPDSGIYWYGRGIVRADGVSWSKTATWTGKELQGNSLSCSFYTVPEQEAMRETYRRTCALADSIGVKEVTPYVALASGYRRNLKTNLKWTDDWDYDLVYSWMLGAELNIPAYAKDPETFAAYDRAKIIIFFPAPFYDGTPAWSKHFIAYVRGAHGIKMIDDLEQ